jgi:hypothetical protein
MLSNFVPPSSPPALPPVLPGAGHADAAAQDMAGASAGRSVVVDRGEFVDALRLLRRGCVLVRPRSAADGEKAACLLDGGMVRNAFDPLQRYRLIEEYHNPAGFAALRYFRITPSGKQFADQACLAWRQRPWLERLAIRLLG